MTTTWLDTYTTALTARDAREQAHKPYIDAFTHLADRTSSNNPLQGNQDPPTSPKPPTPKPIVKTSATPPPPQETERLRADLSTTQKARQTLQSQLTHLQTTLSTLQTHSTHQTAQIKDLTSQKTSLERKLRDREEEVRGKSKLAEDAQDEMVAMGLQVSVAEQKAARLERENGELVARWVARMGEEVERVNAESNWG